MARRARPRTTETELTVQLQGQILGHLRGAGDDFDFEPTRDAIQTWGLGSRMLSAAIPLVPRTTRGREVRSNFFAELLPEGDARKRLADEAGLRRNDVMGMLAAYGRDVAGAIQIWDASIPGEPRTPEVEPLNDKGVRAMLENVGSAPLGNKPQRGKTSLNGVQPKIVLVRTENGWARAIDGYPSTHILKPRVPGYQSMIFDEEYGSRFARALNLASFSTELLTFDGTPALVIERYDRDPKALDGRIHQEDFNQALGLSGDQKYEMFGGKGVRDIAEVIEADDAEQVLKMITLSVAIGNLDLHMKNFSLLHLPGDSVRVAPMYDVVPQHFYDNDGEMALRIGGEFEHRLLAREHLEMAGVEIGIRNPEQIVTTTLEIVREVATSERPHPAAHPGLQFAVGEMATRLLAGKTVSGEAPGAAASSAGGSSGGGGWRWDNPRHHTDASQRAE
ncbi:toxin HipA [Microbacterium sp. MYb66]|nr:toxin HipA [Microbacterium sp. MYb66]